MSLNDIDFDKIKNECKHFAVYFFLYLFKNIEILKYEVRLRDGPEPC